LPPEYKFKDSCYVEVVADRSQSCFQICLLDFKNHTILESGLLVCDQEDWVEGDRCVRKDAEQMAVSFEGELSKRSRQTGMWL
jgi:hypothetical protein